MIGVWRSVLVGCGVAALLVVTAANRVAAQTQPAQPGGAPVTSPRAGNGPAPDTPPAPRGTPGQSATAGTAPTETLPADVAEVTAEDAIVDGSLVHARNVRMHAGEYELSGEHLDGDFDRELVLTGNPVITYRNQTFTGDSIHYWPKTHLFHAVNVHAALSPEFLKQRLTSPLIISGADMGGRAGSELTAGSSEITTCDRPHPDYLLRARAITVEPGKQITLRNTAFVLWGKRLFTLPILVIPLTHPRAGFRTDYMPRVGRSADEGWFAKSAFNYVASKGAPGLLRLDLMEKKGIGLGVDQRWNLTRMAGGLTLYAIPTGPTNRNLSGRLDNQLRLGSGQMLTMGTDFQQNSYLALPETTTLNARLGYTLTTNTLSTNLNVGHSSTDSAGYSTEGVTASFAQTVRLSNRLDMSLGSDYSSNTTSTPALGGTTISQETDQLTARTEVDYRAPNYLLQLTANRNIPVGSGTGQSYFSGTEKLPEITLSNYRFTQGLLSRIPATLTLSAGKYSEGGTGITGAGQPASVVTERLVAGFDVQDERFALTRSTDLSVAGGFQQFFYGDGSAQFTVRSHALLTQMLYKSSGIRMDYSYQQPEGGTPFRFDQQGQYHTLTGDLGLIGDSRLQLTARVGYNLAGTSLGGIALPWQTLSANLLVRPADWARVQNMVSFDPNSGKVLSVTTDMRFRGSHEFAIDLVSRYDPAQHTFGNLNGYFDLPIGRDWRVVTLFQYNGYLSQFESRNVQIVRDLHCMEAALTYSENPFGYRADRQIFFQLRIKAFPIFQKFGTGQFGQALDTSIGGLR